VPRAWTSLATLDAFAVIAAGRARVRPEDLVRLVELVDDVRQRCHDAAESDEVFLVMSGLCPT